MENVIYGVSSKYTFGRWEHAIYAFTDEDTANAWLHTEEYDFRERELMTRDEAIELCGYEAVDEAYYAYNRENQT